MSRQTGLTGLQVLHDVPDIDILSHLPEFLEGVFSMLADKRDANHELSVCLCCMLRYA